MGRKNKCYWYHIKSRQIWRNICAKDIAFEFGMWISPKFKLLLIKEFERLKKEEQKQLCWNAKRELSKINYKIHTDAIKHNLIPTELTKEEIDKLLSRSKFVTLNKLDNSKGNKL